MSTYIQERQGVVGEANFFRNVDPPVSVRPASNFEAFVAIYHNALYVRETIQIRRQNQNWSRRVDSSSALTFLQLFHFARGSPEREFKTLIKLAVHSMTRKTLTLQQEGVD